jgi:hypothetical protein
MSGTLAIPADAFVSVTPSVIGTGGNALDLNGLLLTHSTRVPVGAVQPFSSVDEVGSLFGLSSQEATLAGVYFLGFDNSDQKPGSLLIAQYNQVDVGAWLRGASIADVSLATLRALTGSLSVVIDGGTVTVPSIDLSAAVSYSDAAEILTVAMGTTGPAAASFTAAISGSVMTVSAMVSGTIAVGQEVRGGGTASGTLVTALGTGTGGTGTYTVSQSQTVGSGSLVSNVPTVTYDSITGAFLVQSATTGPASTIDYASGTAAAGLRLTLGTGATKSQGIAAAVPATYMGTLTKFTQNWASFMTAFDPDGGSGNDVKKAFVAWVNSTLDRYVYVAWDNDASPTASPTATTSLGRYVLDTGPNGTCVVYSPADGPTKAMFVMGSIASVDFTAIEGRVNFAYKGQAGITADVVDRTVFDNLMANGYNCYVNVATANDHFRYFYPGSVSGQFKWLDSYVDQIWLTNQFKLAMISFLTAVKSAPYNADGYTRVRASLMDPIKQGKTFGAFRGGVTLSQAQISEVNTSAGKKIDDVLSAQGWYLKIDDALPQVRGLRESPPIKFWYMDGQSMNRLAMSAIEVA